MTVCRPEKIKMPPESVNTVCLCVWVLVGGTKFTSPAL